MTCDVTTFFARDPLCSHADHAKFLRSLIANAEKNLSAPNTRYPNGLMSHDVERETLNRAESALHDLMLQGYYYADGRFAGFGRKGETRCARNLRTTRNGAQRRQQWERT